MTCMCPAGAPPVLSCHVDGMPATKGSYKPVRNRRTGKTLLVGMNKNEHQWRAHVAETLRSQWFAQHRTSTMPRLDAPLCVHAVFLLPRPKSVRPTTRPWPSVAPDIDKLSRCLLDAITDSELIHDDGRVIHLDAVKHYAPTPHTVGVGLTIHTIATEEEPS